MPAVIRFNREEDHEHAIAVLTETEATYHGVALATTLVSYAALRALEAAEARFHIVSETSKEQSD